jgi:hypothetical protein
MNAWANAAMPTNEASVDSTIAGWSTKPCGSMPTVVAARMNVVSSTPASVPRAVKRAAKLMKGMTRSAMTGLSGPPLIAMPTPTIAWVTDAA